MYIVIGATEDAQKLLTQKQLLDLVRSADIPAMPEPVNGVYNLEPAVVEHDGDGDGKKETYYVWCHDAGTYKYRGNYDGKWTLLSGSYTVPEGQYRTRMFFVSEPEVSATEKASKENAGNLIDAAKAGQYKSYLIEYYEETYDGDANKIIRLVHDDSGAALVYSTVDLEYLNTLIKEEHDYLHQILINGQNYPYSIRYSDDTTATLYIEKYEEVNKHGVPVPLLIVQGIIVTAWAAILTFGSGSSGGNVSFQTAISLTVIIYLSAYILFFIAYLVIVFKKKELKREYQIPGGSKVKIFVAGSGLLLSIAAIITAFMIPDTMSKTEGKTYITTLIFSYIVTVVAPFLFYQFYSKNHSLKGAAHHEDDQTRMD